MKSLLSNQCPRCKKADLFCSRNPYDFKKLFLMYEHCASCGLKFNKEPGFFYGAMYVGYGISVAYLTIFYVGMLVLLGDFELTTYFIFGIGSLFLLTPVIFRFSRSVWISLFVSYDQSSEKRWEKETNGTEIENPCVDV